MLRFELLPERDILAIVPDGPLEKADFEQFAQRVDPLIASAGRVAGLMIDIPSFPGWGSFGAFVSHLKFAIDYHRHIERIAVVTNNRLLRILPRVATHIVKPNVRQFAAHEKAKALTWLEAGK
jgi:SpoIIAA-like